MTAENVAALITAASIVIGSFIGLVRWLVKHYLAELKPNGGASMNDRLARVERQIEQIYQTLLQK
jgi:hypothetical protein